ncbi:MAG: hypothetical protein OS112_00355 [Methanoregula sp.]|nr:MAG: hypothetical protein OS112_00355 [Methanoregula sp.]
MPLKFSKRYDVCWVIVNPQEIKKISRIIQEVYNNAIKDYEIDYKKYKESKGETDYPTKPSLRYKIQYSHNTIRCNTIEDLIPVLDDEKISSFEIQFNSSNLDISVNLNHAKYCGSYNYFDIAGLDKVKVNGLFNSLKEAVDSFQKQSSVFKEYKIPITIVLSFICGIILIGVSSLFWDFYFYLSHTPVQNITISDNVKNLIKISIVPILIFGSLLGGMGPAFYISDKISDLYPSVELNTGPDYGQSEKRKRDSLYTIITIIVIPLILTIAGILIK